MYITELIIALISTQTAQLLYKNGSSQLSYTSSFSSYGYTPPLSNTHDYLQAKYFLEQILKVHLKSRTILNKIFGVILSSFNSAV